MIAEAIAQVGIIVFGVLAAWITQQRNESLKKYACVFGLASQPFWFYSSWESGQWGIFVVSGIYTVVWAIGFKNYWLSPANLPAAPAINSDSLQSETKQ